MRFGSEVYAREARPVSLQRNMADAAAGRNCFWAAVLDIRPDGTWLRPPAGFGRLLGNCVETFVGKCAPGRLNADAAQLRVAASLEHPGLVLSAATRPLAKERVALKARVALEDEVAVRPSVSTELVGQSVGQRRAVARRACNCNVTDDGVFEIVLARRTAQRCAPLRAPELP